MSLPDGHSDDHAPYFDSSGDESQNLLIAVTSPRDVGSSLVHFHRFGAESSSSQSLPGASCYTYHALGTMGETGCGGWITKVILRNKRSLETLQCLGRRDTLDGTASAWNEEKDSAYPGPTIAKIDTSAFVSQYQVGTGKTPIVDVFTKMEMQYGNGIRSTQHIHVQNSRGLRSLGKPDARPLRSVAISTGMCLFSKAFVPPHDIIGEGVNVGFWTPRTLPPTQLTIYELEITTRLATTIADIVGLLRNDCGSDNPSIIVNVDIPDVQYCWGAFELLQKGVVTRTQVQTWIAAVDERRCKLWRFIETAIRDMLDARLLSPVQILLAGGTASVRKYLSQAAATGVTPSLDDILDVLNNDGHDTHRWNKFLQHAGVVYGPKDIPELGRLFHVFNSLDLVLHTTSRMVDCRVDASIKYERPQLLLQVDDIFEWKIFDRARSILKAYQTDVCHDIQIQIVGLFPLQKIFAGGNGRSSLWTNPPGPLLRSIANNHPYLSADVLSTVYGKTMWPYIARWMKQSSSY
jgi:hypothetical protein